MERRFVKILMIFIFLMIYLFSNVDSNKFGQKMLEKMGWTSGKGLGVNEQGITEHVRVSFKNDTGGKCYLTTNYI